MSKGVIVPGRIPPVRHPREQVIMTTTAAGTAAKHAFGTTVREKRKQLGLRLSDVADRIGCRKGYLSMIETGQRPPPSRRFIGRLEEALEFETGALREAAHWENAPPGVRHRVEEMQSAAQKAHDLAERLLKNPRNLDELLRSGELERLVEHTAGNIDTPLPLTRRVPVINRVAAGYPTHFTDLDYPAQVADAYLDAPADLTDAQAFAARVVGDSMEPEYHEGDTVVFSPDAPTPNGADCFVRLEPDHDTTFKRVFFEEGEEDGNGGGDGDSLLRIRLKPLNAAYPDRVVPREQVAGMYAATYVMRRVGGVCVDGDTEGG